MHLHRHPTAGTFIGFVTRLPWPSSILMLGGGGGGGVYRPVAARKCIPMELSHGRQVIPPEHALQDYPKLSGLAKLGINYCSFAELY